MPGSVKGIHNAFLLGGRQLGKDRGFLGNCRKLGITHLRDLAAQQNFAGFKIYIVADFPGDHFIIAG